MQKNRASVVKLAPSVSFGAHTLQVKIEELYRKLLAVEPDQEVLANDLIFAIRRLEQRVIDMKIRRSKTSTKLEQNLQI